jgi:non-heme chloroperoxidase
MFLCFSIQSHLTLIKEFYAICNIWSTGATPVEIYYEVWGAGKPVIFIHGWPLDHQMWEYHLNYLAGEGLRCIAYDRRGFGRSVRRWTSYDYDTVATDLKALPDHLNLVDVTLVGFSMGGGEVARYFSEFNRVHVSTVVLIASVLPFMLKTDDNQSGIEQEIVYYRAGS